MSSRVKCNFYRISNEPPSYELVNPLIKWCRIFGERGYAPMLSDGGSAGNLSYISKAGIVITCSKIGLKQDLTNNEFAVIVDKPSTTLSFNFGYKGSRDPSSEVPFHSAIYGWMPEVKAVFHGHEDSVLRHAGKLRLIQNKEEKTPGSRELVEEIIKTLYAHKFKLNHLIMPNHGFITLGKDLDEAGNLAIDICEKARKLG